MHQETLCSAQAKKRLHVGLLLQAWGVPRPGGLLVSGPAGSGKSALVAAAGQALELHPQCLTHTVMVKCREMTWEGGSHAQALISAKVNWRLAGNGSAGAAWENPVWSTKLPSALRACWLVACIMLCCAEQSTGRACAYRASPGFIAADLDVAVFLHLQVREALEHMPSLLVFDDLDVLCRADSDGPDGGGAPSDPGLTAWLCDVLDYLCTPAPEWGALPPWLQHPCNNGSSKSEVDGSSSSGQEPRKEGQAAVGSNGNGRTNGSLAGAGTAAPAALSNQQAVAPSATLAPTLPSGLLWPPVAFAATCKDVAALAAPLRAAGRLDQPLPLPAPSAESRAAILAGGVRARGAYAAPADLQALAEHADGFDAADLEVLLDRAMHLALRRRLASASVQQPGSRLHPPTAGATATAATAGNGTAAAEAEAAGSWAEAGQGPLVGQEAGRQVVASRGRHGAELSSDDLMGALEGMTPAAFWGVHTQKSVQQVGGALSGPLGVGVGGDLGGLGYYVGG